MGNHHPVRRILYACWENNKCD